MSSPGNPTIIFSDRSQIIEFIDTFLSANSGRVVDMLIQHDGEVRQQTLDVRGWHSSEPDGFVTLDVRMVDDNGNHVGPERVVVEWEQIIQIEFP